ncbi:MAG: glycoside hydrolase family 127 protein [Planctomycetota bacterium]|nr:glycoside hydrolase family 127 protein [Planctomycetota bacterium]
MRPYRARLCSGMAFLLAMMAAAGTSPGDSLTRESENKMKVAPRITAKAYAFPLKDVRLLDGPFKHAMDLDQAYLLSLDPDRLLHNFRTNAGLPSSAKPLGGWEGPAVEVRGHFIGHYLSACAMMYASTGDARLKERAALLVAEMAKCQDKFPSGYLSAYPEEFIDRVETQKRVWAPWYTLHKIYAGLIDVYVLCDNAQALEVVEKMADWAKARTDRLSGEQMEKMLGNEHGGMNDAFAELYAVTGQEKYLRLSQRFNHKAVLDPLANREDKLTGLHANTQFPKVIGAARQYELTGDERLRTLATFFWEGVTRERSYVIGGNSDGEHFSPKERLSQALGPSTTETCNTYNMLKLTRHLFAWQPQAGYADYYERALYNHILASQNPEDGMTCYYVPLRTGSRKTFSSTYDAFWCCTGTGVENHAKYADSIYFREHGRRGLFVNLFIASELAWREEGIKVRQETKYPEVGATRLIVTCDKAKAMNLNVRHPWWAVSGVEVAVNGRKLLTSSTPGSYYEIGRTWDAGDTVVDITMPMTLRTEAFRDNPRRLAVLYGPLVLCAEADPGKEFPVLRGNPEEVAPALKPVPGRTLEFAVPAPLVRIAGQDPAGDVTLTPFYRMYKKPYIVYWDVLTDEQWKQKQEEHQAEAERRQALAARAVDAVEIGRADSERAHDLKGEKTGAGEFGGKHWRHATDGGWFSYRMKVMPDKPVELLCTYWGSDGGSRTFDLLVDGTKIATEKLANNRPGKFYDQVYAIPPDLTRGKDAVVLRFQAHPGNWAGGVFGCMILKKD